MTSKRRDNKFVRGKLLSANFKVTPESIRFFKQLVVKHQKPAVEKLLLGLMPKQNDQKLSVLLIFYFFVLNWSTIKEIKESAATLSQNKFFDTSKHADKFSDKCGLKS